MANIFDRLAGFLAKSKKEEPVAPKAIAWSNNYRGVANPNLGIPKEASGVSFLTLRRISYIEPIVRSCVDIIKKEVSQSPWRIVKDPLAKSMSEDEFRRAHKFFRNINPDGENMRILLDRTVEDLLVLDAGVWELLPNSRGEIVGVNSVDGASIRFKTDSKGQDLSFVQVVDGHNVADFTRDEIIYMMMNPQNNVQRYPYGMSPIEGILLAIQSSLNADLYNANMFASDNVPQGILHLGNIKEYEAEAIKAMWDAQVVGNQHGLKFMWGQDKIDFMDFKKSNKDMQYIQYLDRLTRIILAKFGLSAIDLNIIQDVNRSTSQAQQKLSNSRGVQTVKHLIQETINTRLFSAMQLETIMFEFDKTVDLNERKLLAEIDKIYVADIGAVTINEVRQRDGFDILEDESNELQAIEEEDELKETEEDEEDTTDEAEVSEKDTDERVKKSSYPLLYK